MQQTRANKKNMIVIYPRLPRKEIIRAYEELATSIPQWFKTNPDRKICRIELFYGREVHVTRENYKTRLAKELEKDLAEAKDAKAKSSKSPIQA